MTKKPKTSKDAADKVLKDIRHKTCSECTNSCTGYKKDLIGALNSSNNLKKAFYLGNVGQMKKGMN